MPAIIESNALSTTLDVDGAAATFARSGRVRIADFLEESSAARLYACLETEVPWRLIYNEGEKQTSLDEQALAKLGTDGQREVLHRVLTRAQDHFQYLYRSFPMVTAYKNGEYPDLFLHRVFEFLNEPDTLDLLRKVTGIADLLKADAQATLYRPGHFLTRHDDIGRDNEHRRVAYVLGMTRNWRADWGGHLQFLDENGEVEEVWMPRFNSLALFRVPTPHTVSYVAPYAKQPRYAITGWLCDA
jgi:Rps23 Pro-64 3,4-dihydroxylase Tpa1-like proline 4-hydroxylase